MSTRVLCVSSGAVARFYSGKAEAWFCSDATELEQFRDVARKYSFYVDRNRAENDFGLVQLIPSCVIASGTKVLCVERTANSSRHELRSKWTSVFGGHIDEADKDPDNAWQTILNGAVREVREELGLEVARESLHLAGLAIDPTNRTGRLHLGLLFIHMAPSDRVRLTVDLDLAEFNVARLETIRFFTPKEIFHVQDRFDPWSTLFWKSDFARSCLRPDPFADEELPLLRAACM